MKMPKIIPALLTVLILPSCAGREERVPDGVLNVGILLASTDGVRWSREAQYLVEKADEMGMRPLLREAGGDPELQKRQARELIAEGADVLVFQPADPISAAPIVGVAKDADLPVLAYRAPVPASEFDLYVGPDGEEGGYLQAQAALERTGEGGAVIIGGGENAWSALRVRAGRERAFSEWSERREREITVLADFVLPSSVGEGLGAWLDSEFRSLEKGLYRVSIVLADSDAAAGAVIESLENLGWPEQVTVAGWGADLAACRRIIKGTQAVTVFTPSRELAALAVRAAARLASGMDPDDAIKDMGNREREIEVAGDEYPALMLSPVVVTRGNMIETVVLDGRYSVEEIYGEE